MPDQPNKQRILSSTIVWNNWIPIGKGMKLAFSLYQPQKVTPWRMQITHILLMVQKGAEINAQTDANLVIIHRATVDCIPLGKIHLQSSKDYLHGNKFSTIY